MQIKKQEILARMRLAAAEPATARLLTTPLQVTILTSLLEKIGRAPRERWALFHKYFTHIYEREIERQTYASGLLRDHRTHIEQIHQRAGLLLQGDAEMGGDAAVGMSRTRLHDVIDTVLADDGIEGAARQPLVHEIALAAEQRLVFLVEPQPNSFGFEIRPLQEFMAAWALANGEDQAVKARLEQIKPAPMFENVLLFIASRFFAEASHLREFLVGPLTDSLTDNAPNELATLTLPGARLALRILVEGSVLSQPKYVRPLVQAACKLFGLPADKCHLQLAQLDRTADKALEEQLTQALASQYPLAAWLCLTELIQQDLAWAIRLGNTFWPQLETPDRLVQLRFDMGVKIGDWLDGKISAELREKYAKLRDQLRELLGPKGRANMVAAVTEVFGFNKKQFLQRITEEPVQLQEAMSQPGIFFHDLERSEDLFGSEDTTIQFAEIVQLFASQTNQAITDLIEWTIMQVYLGNLPLEQDDRLPGEIMVAAQDRPHILTAFISALSYKRLPPDRHRALLIATYRQLGPTHPKAGKLIEQMLHLLQAETSGLSNPVIWHHLALPALGPQSGPNSGMLGDMPSSPIQIDALELQDVRKFRHLQFEFTPAEPEQGQWIVILGSNGAGKTTILRSLALALRNVKDPSIWREEAFIGWQRITAPGERSVPAKISVKLSGRQYQTTIRKNGSSKFEQTPPHTRSRLFPLFAYGCRRGSALGGASTMVKLGDNGGPEIATLFSEGADLIHAETWLIQMDGDAAKNQHAKQVYEAIIGALKQLLAVEQIEVAERTLWITEAGQNRMPFSFFK